MNIVEAEKFFKEYDGNSFYMYDQDLLKYNQYRSMKISSKQENIWRIQKAKIYSSEIEKSDKPWLVYFILSKNLQTNIRWLDKNKTCKAIFNYEKL